MGIKFIVGLALGAAAYHFLNTEDGKVFVSKVRKSASDTGGNLASMAEDLLQKGKALVGDIKSGMN